jgi:phage-related protein
MANGIELAKAYVQIVPSTEGIQGELEKAMGSAGEKAGEKGGRSIASGIGKVAGGIGKVAAAGLAAAGTAAVGATTALVAGTSALAQQGDEIDKMSQKMGLSAEAYQEWDAVLQHSGTSISSLLPSMKTLSNAAETGNDAFAALGISEEQVANLSKEDLFSAVITGLQGMEEGTERTYLASQLLGRGATELGPLLNTSAEETQAMRDRVHELGGVLSNEAVANSAAFQDNLQDMQTAMAGLKNSIIQQALPGMNQLMEGFTGLITGEEGASETIGAGFETLLGDLGNIVTQIADVVKELFPELMGVITENLPTIIETGLGILMELATAIIEALPDIVKSIMDMLPTVLPQIIDAFVGLFLLIVENFAEIIDPIIQALPDVINSLTDAIIRNLPQIIMGIIKLVGMIIVRIPQILLGLWQTITHFFSEAWNQWVAPNKEKILGFFRGIWEGIKGAFSAVTTWFRNIFSKAWQAVKNVFSAGGRVFEGIKEGIAGVFHTVVNAIIRGINAVIAAPFNAINGIFNRLRGISILRLTPFSWLPTLAVPQIPQLATGGVLERGQMGLLEGTGAEAVVPLEKNTGWIKRVAFEMQQAGPDSYADAADEVVDAIRGMRLYLDGNQLVGGVIARVDKGLGNRQIQAQRGLAML